MLVDRSHIRWGVFTAAAAVAAVVVYAAAWRMSPEGLSGGDPLGLAYGIIGSGLMVFAGLLSLRKKKPRWRIGTAQWWLRGHLWLGLLSVPLIVLHAGFRWGGQLETALLAVYAIVIVSGLFGLAVQQYLPRVMRDAAPHEAMPEQMENVCDSLRRLADQTVADAYPEIAAAVELIEPHAGGSDRRLALRTFYVNTVRPFLRSHRAERSQLFNPALSDALFAQTHAALPAPTSESRGATALHDALERLNDICRERRNLLRQMRMHRWLHGWLLLHVPLSIALLVLGVAHAVSAIYY